MPVSYTHLDVYKRQAARCAVFRWAFCGRAHSAFPWYTVRREAVSFTHLYYIVARKSVKPCMAAKFNTPFLCYGENVSFEYGGNADVETYSCLLYTSSAPVTITVCAIWKTPFLPGCAANSGLVRAALFLLTGIVYHLSLIHI